MIIMRSKFRLVATMSLILVVLFGSIGPISAMIQAQLIPPSPYSVYTNQVYSLTVGVQYNIPPEAQKTYGPYLFWIESPPYQSGQGQLQGSGTASFSLTLQAPSTPGTYTLGLKLLVQAKGQSPTIMDTATVTYQVIEPIITDWDVDKVWIEPESPSVDDQITFHATIALKKTNSAKPLTVDVACYLDKKYYSGSSLTFSPQPSVQDIAISKPWKATEGPHTIMFVVDPNGQHNDPTPFPTYNHKDLTFTVQPYYAIIQSITLPKTEVKEYEEFTVIVTVEYKFPGTANLRIHHLNNFTDPFTDDLVTDTVTGAGTKDYKFTARASSAPFGNLTKIVGSGDVTFDKGAGWQKTTLGWWKSYELWVRGRDYYAVIDSMTAEYAGATTGSSESAGTIEISLQIRYLLPLESGLRIVVTGLNGTEVWRDEATATQTEIVERTGEYRYIYTFPAGIAYPSGGSITFHATVEYIAWGSWHVGDAQSVAVSLPYTAPPTSWTDYFEAAIQRIIDWFKQLFGQT